MQADLSRVMGKGKARAVPLPQGRPQSQEGLALGKPSRGRVTSVAVAAGGDSDRNPIAKRQAVLSSSRS